MYYKKRRMLTVSELYMIWYLLPYFTMHRLNPIRSGPLNFIPLKLGMRSEAMSTSSSIETTRMQDNSRVHYTLQLCGCLELYQHSSKVSKEVDIYNKHAIVPPFGLHNYATYVQLWHRPQNWLNTCMYWSQHDWWVLCKVYAWRLKYPVCHVRTATCGIRCALMLAGYIVEQMATMKALCSLQVRMKVGPKYW